MRACCLLLLLLGCVAPPDDVERIGGGVPTSAPERPAWPPAPSPPPACTPTLPGFAMPPLDAPSGTLRLRISADLQPVGAEVPVRIEARDPGSGEVDESVEGDVLVSVQGGSVVSQTPMSAGRAWARLRFDGAGAHTVSMGLLATGDEGSAQVFAYTPQVPVWNLEIDDGQLAFIVQTVAEGVLLPMRLHIGDASWEGTLRLHGGSSRWYRKKSFRLDLDSPLPDGSDHVILRAEFADKTMLRNHLGLAAFRELTWLPTPSSELVHVRVNDEWYAAMWHVERIDGDFLRRRDLDTNNSLYEADPDGAEYWVPGGNLTPLADREAYERTYQHHRGDSDYDDLIAFIEDVLTLDDGAFAAAIDDEVRVDDLVTYLAVMTALQNQDHIRKNYYLYRHPDGRWLMLPWDLDLTFGHLWTEENDILDETIFVDGTPYIGVEVPEHGYFNRLIDRVLALPERDAQFREAVEHVGDALLGGDFLAERIDQTLCLGTPEFLIDDGKRASNDEYPGRVAELADFATGRLGFLGGDW